MVPRSAHYYTHDFGAKVPVLYSEENEVAPHNVEVILPVLDSDQAVESEEEQPMPSPPDSIRNELEALSPQTTNVMVRSLTGVVRHQARKVSVSMKQSGYEQPRRHSNRVNTSIWRHLNIQNLIVSDISPSGRKLDIFIMKNQLLNLILFKQVNLSKVSRLLILFAGIVGQFWVSGVFFDMEIYDEKQ